MQAWLFWSCAAATEDIEENAGMTGICDEMKKPAGWEAPTSPPWLETNRGWKSKNVKPSIAFTISNIRLYCGTLFNGHCGKPHFKRVFKLFKVIWIPSCIAWNGKGSFAHYCTDLHWHQTGKHCVAVNFQICTDLHWYALICTNLHWYALICTDLHWSAPICTDSKQTNTVLGSKSSKCSLQEGVKPTEPAADINFKTTSRLSNKE